MDDFDSHGRLGSREQMVQARVGRGCNTKAGSRGGVPIGRRAGLAALVARRVDASRAAYDSSPDRGEMLHVKVRPSAWTTSDFSPPPPFPLSDRNLSCSYREAQPKARQPPCRRSPVDDTLAQTPPAPSACVSPYFHLRTHDRRPVCWRYCDSRLFNDPFELSLDTHGFNRQRCHLDPAPSTTLDKDPRSYRHRAPALRETRLGPCPSGRRADSDGGEDGCDRLRVRESSHRRPSRPGRK
ncbi:hypothetical protein BDY21DRAFT_175627 [Lineolata rhizophorae]|uniref:Uncharacterized protein n=1 Tax=Lineolata rhizophorae TaxID=578093 RepID=A0A6A6NM60_9PEZI|nr:hypothetical protein BDY21DRAFT_175627 [Lineolata rhizophorae]